MIKKIFVAIILFALISIMSIVIIKFNFKDNCIYAKSVNVENAKLVLNKNSCIQNENLGIVILPNNYNQSIKYSSSNENIAYFDSNGNLYSNSSKGEATLSVFVKSSKTETIFSTFTVTVVIEEDNSSNHNAYFESNMIELEENSKAFNILYADNTVLIETSSKNNLINYDYNTGEISFKEKANNNSNFDIISVKINYSDGSVQILQFTVFIIKIIKLNINETYIISFENNNFSYEQLSHKLSNSNIISIYPTYNQTIVIAINTGITYYTISNSSLVYKAKIIVNI